MPQTYTKSFTALLAPHAGSYRGWSRYPEIGAPVIVTYCFAEGAHVIPPEAGKYVTATGAFTPEQRENFRTALAHYAQNAGLVFLELEDGGMIRVAGIESALIGGWAGFGMVSAADTSSVWNLILGTGNSDPGSYEYMIMLHELGHNMGLKHPHEGNVRLDPSIDNTRTTLMSYTHAAASGAHPAELTVMDIAALQYLYGPPVDISGWHIVADEMNKVLRIEAGTRDDIITGVDFSSHLYGGAGDDRLYGRHADDILDGGAGRNWLSGGHGDDILHGRGRGDAIDGGAGSDVIIFTPVRQFADGYYAVNVSGHGQIGTGKTIGLKGYHRVEAVIDGGGVQGMDILQLSHKSDALFLDDAFSAFHPATVLETFAGDIENTARILRVDEIRSLGGDDLIDLTSARFRLENEGRIVKILGGDGDDIIWGSANAEAISGGAGRDTIFGGAGADVLSGGSGADHFEFTGTLDRCRIVDFNPAEGDVLRFYSRPGAEYEADSLYLGRDYVSVAFTAPDDPPHRHRIDLGEADDFMFTPVQIDAAIEFV